MLDLSAGIECKGFLSVADIVLDLTSRDSAEKNFLLHQLGEVTRGEGSYLAERRHSLSS